ncbi:MAG: PD40 domain-containing protein [Bacteroidia bacterium]|nr:PD40 domain-containing protein [Bacteroidia bacterium]
MNTLQRVMVILLAFLSIYNTELLGVNPKDTRMLAEPTISANHIVFIYAEDLWVANLDGSQPRRLTIDEGVESNPMFSPDGSLIAFSAQYDGNTDVFLVPVEGGVPTRLTWHPASDFVRGFTPDGKAVLFASQRAVFTNRYAQLFTVPVVGGYPTQLEIPNAWRATYAPDGKSMAYTPISGRYKQWKNYRGGTTVNIWLFSFEDHSVEKIPQPEGGCNDTDPMWIGDQVYFRSDRNGEFNLYSYNLSSKKIDQHTQFNDFPVLGASNGNGNIIFEQAGYLHTFDVSASNSKKLTVGIAADLLELRPRFVKGGKYIRSAGISPSGARVLFDYRGDIITVPAEKGDPRNLTLSTGTHEKYPAWSSDGKSIAYFSDASGEYKLHIKSQDGKGDAKSFQLSGNGFYAHINWSPNSKKLCYVDNGRNLYILDIKSGSIKKIDADELYIPGAFRNSFGDWSPDSKWLVYTKITSTNFEKVFLYSLDQDMSFSLTDGMSNASQPLFDPNGKYLYFLASTDAGPVVNWFAQSSADMVMTSSIYLVTLRKDIVSPFAKESDEEGNKDVEAKDKDENGKVKKSKKVEPVKIDLEGIQNRIIDIPLKAGNYSQLSMNKKGQLLYVSKAYNNSGPGMLHRYDLKDRKDSEIMKLDYYTVAAGGEKMLYRKAKKWGITGAGKKPKAGKGIINIAGLRVKIDPLSEWPHIFDEAWRINRDYFYDPGMHGTDWPAMKDKYAQFLPDLACRSDLNKLIQWMCSELSVGHHRVWGGERLNNPPKVNGGLLGVNYKINNNRYQLEKIFGGLNWTPKLRSPLTEPGINAKAGDYLLAVNGNDITADKNLYSFFENTAGKILELTIGPNANYSDSRVVKVVPLANEYALRNRDWVEGNMKKVHEATDGQVAYVYVPNTAGAGHQYFKRYFFPQADKKAIIIDERFNGGGQLADYYIDILMRPYQSYWNFRYGQDVKTPTASIQGPKVMIIDETAGSGGDMLPWMFRKFNVGTLVGKRTWGGLVGILGFPEFIDGGTVMAPNLAIWTKDGFIVENVGVPPDIEVEQWPVEVIKGNDPQLQKAIEIALEELENNPQEKPKRPPYPIRVRK